VTTGGGLGFDTFGPVSNFKFSSLILLAAALASLAVGRRRLSHAVNLMPSADVIARHWPACSSKRQPIKGAIELPNSSEADIYRRTLLAGTGLAAMSTVLPGAATPAAAAEPDAPPPSRMPVGLEVNGQRHDLVLDTRTTLLDALREHLHLTGSKKGCDHGQCGACTVMVDGIRINACLSLAVMHQGQKITTIEGLGTPEQLHPMQAAFVKHDGYQCGYCTPGQICSAVAVLDEIKRGVPSHVQADLMAAPRATNIEMRERMSGNICRCGAYSNIAEAMAEVAGDNA
jgi:xanthine dehydrogenase YagT iron-sulfur-binding subunit